MERSAKAVSLDARTLALLGFMWALLLGNFALYRAAPLPLPFHIAISVLAIHLAFTIWHEAAHRNIARSGRLDDVFGILGMFPYMTPYFMQRWIHLQHHARLNEREDPNFVYTDGPFHTIFLRYFRALTYASRLLQRDPRSRGERISDAVFLGVVAAVYVAAWTQGMLLDVLLLWTLPVVIAKVIMDWYINYLPHVGLPPHRFRGTRVVDAAWFTPLVLGHNYHAIHHLWPSEPWHRYPSIFREKIEYLREHGVPIENSLFGRRAGAGGTAGPNLSG